MADNQCAQCGQWQKLGTPEAAPMLHLAARGIYSRPEDMVSYHLDCLPYDLAEAHMDKHGSRIRAAREGVRGDELRAIADDDTEGDA